MTLTIRQKQIIDFIDDYSQKKGVSPSLEEIRIHFKLNSVSTVHQHIETLKKKGYLSKEKNQRRSIDLSKNEMIRVPLLGIIAAGNPIEAIQGNESIALPKTKIPKNKDVYALKVEGDSMIDEGINNGDTILIKNQNYAQNGDKVVAIINNNEATLKTFYKERNHVRLQPANSNYQPLIVKNNQPITIQGVLIDVIKSNQIQEGMKTFSLPHLSNTKKHYKTLPLNKIICGDAIEEMKKIPANSIDMTFADPPFNLNKKYNSYKDKKVAEDYIKWCEEWLTEMVRITKPTGSILVHNIPKWLVYYANHLNKIATFKHWIAWDSMSIPLGKTLLPAHYGILFYTKSPKGFKFHELRAPHKKCRTCGEMIKDYGGKKKQIHPHGTLLSDVWSDIHRIRHTARRDEHPCQLPEPLLERLILMTTNENDVVLDPFIGAGTTALAAKRLGRNYIGIDLDQKYKKIVSEKLEKINYRHSNGYRYNIDTPELKSKYLKNLTISEDEGVFPIEN